MINQDIWPDHIGPQRHNGHTPSKPSSPDTTEPDAVRDNDGVADNDGSADIDGSADTTQAEGSVLPAQSGGRDS
jgi:hypothetical protein